MLLVKQAACQYHGHARSAGAFVPCSHAPNARGVVADQPPEKRALPAAFSWPLRLRSRGRDGDLFGLRTRLLRNHQREHAILELALGVIEVRALGQREAPRKRAMLAL